MTFCESKVDRKSYRCRRAIKELFKWWLTRRLSYKAGGSSRTPLTHFLQMHEYQGSGRVTSAMLEGNVDYNLLPIIIEDHLINDASRTVSGLGRALILASWVKGETQRQLLLPRRGWPSQGLLVCLNWGHSLRRWSGVTQLGICWDVAAAAAAWCLWPLGCKAHCSSLLSSPAPASASAPGVVVSKMIILEGP